MKELNKNTNSLKLTGAESIAKMLSGYGVTHVFYVEGILRRSLVEMEKIGIKRILTHSEMAAAYMADGYARASGRPAVALAQSVGAANLAAGLQDAYLGRSPVLAITGRKPALSQYRNAYQEILHNKMFEPVTKFQARVDILEQMPLLLTQAFREAVTGSPRPVHLDIAGYGGELIELAETDKTFVVEDQFSRYPSFRPIPDNQEMKSAATLLSEIERAVIVAGNGARISGASAEIIKLAEMLQIPVATSLSAKGIISDEHPLSVGVVGSYSRWCANKVVTEADLVFFVGSGTGDQVTNDWKVPPYSTRVIQLDIEAPELGRNYTNQVSLLGDAKRTVAGLIELVEPRYEKTPWTEQCIAIVEMWCEENESKRISDAVPIIPERLCKEIGDVIPENAVIVVCTGYSGVWSASMLNLKGPPQIFLRAAGSLGWAFPAALGAKCAVGERKVICFTGDGGFLYHLSELETAARWGINVVVVVNNNHCLAQCIRGIDRAYDKDIGKKEDMYVFRELNFAEIAKNMGCEGIRVENPSEIKPVLQKSISLDKPVVVDVVTERDHAAQWPPPDFSR